MVWMMRGERTSKAHEVDKFGNHPFELTVSEHRRGGERTGYGNSMRERRVDIENGEEARQYQTSHISFMEGEDTERRVERWEERRREREDVQQESRHYP